MLVESMRFGRESTQYLRAIRPATPLPRALFAGRLKAMPSS
ncbi:hypothetical protein HMPREF0731_3377 [Pseudoroseomonas cervicalis ATCC 49957]|uniref:Uncharacterized protein n=1 Tax=Pseudoroseomonas cervicalis ATCC 49957 TaxID=525371 RepID=D5RQL5_9PROT|nr:hypothetical protein HMPREF0731_3377 [Pseudoroseomonas cervicalis ATCC 49957]